MPLFEEKDSQHHKGKRPRHGGQRTLDAGRIRPVFAILFDCLSDGGGMHLGQNFQINLFVLCVRVRRDRHEATVDENGLAKLVGTDLVFEFHEFREFCHLEDSHLDGRGPFFGGQGAEAPQDEQLFAVNYDRRDEDFFFRDVLQQWSICALLSGRCEERTQEKGQDRDRNRERPNADLS